VGTSADPAGDRSAGRRDNGLTAPGFVPIAEVDLAFGPTLLAALGRAQIAAYLQSTVDPGRELLYASSTDRGDANTIVAAVWRAARAAAAESVSDPVAGESADESDSAPHASDPATVDPMRQAVSVPDPLAGRDTDSEFHALIADWHVDTVAAIRSAERDLNREDAEWRARISPPPPSTDDEEEHFVPPMPPPLPRLAATTIGAILLVAASILLLVAGGRLGLGTDMTFFVGVGGILFGAGVFVMKLRAQPSEDDDDGAVL
jgi:hypothetical protein